MIVRPPLHWARMLFVWRGSVVPQILPRLAVFFAWGCVVVAVHERWGPLPLGSGAGSLGLVGVALAIFLGFRNSTSYARFWEGRTLWGSLLNVVRSFVRQAMTMPTPALSPEERLYVVRWCVQLTRSLHRQLRREETAEAAPVEALAAEIKDRVYPAAWATRRLGAFVHALRREGRITDLLATAMEHNLDRLSDIIGGCERIATTPIPYVYSVLLHRTVYVYAALLPIALVDTLGRSTPWMALFVSYTFIALDRVTAELEDPFGVEPNDLPLDALTRTIERAACELADEPVRPALEPDEGYQLR